MKKPRKTPSKRAIKALLNLGYVEIPLCTLIKLRAHGAQTKVKAQTNISMPTLQKAKDLGVCSVLTLDKINEVLNK